MTHRNHRRRDREQPPANAASRNEITTHPIELALLEAGHETGFWDDNGRPAPWPDDIDEWSPITHEPLTFQPGEPPF